MVRDANSQEKLTGYDRSAVYSQILMKNQYGLKRIFY
jgi:hypothetical protein